MSEKKSKNKALRTVLIIVLVLAVFVAGFLGFYTVTEYRPEDVEGLSAYGTMSKELHTGDTIDILTWNIGFAGLGANEDFFMDGGSGVHPENVDEVTANLDGIESFLLSQNPDVAFLQEVDIDSARTYHINEVSQIETITPDYVHSFANNFKVSFLPYPIPPLGKIDSGIQTVSRYAINEAWRVQLPIPFSWPTRMVNLKRCLMVDRVPIADSDKELVLINLHLEAYDDGEGKVAQTRMLLYVLEEEYEKGNYVIAGGDFNQSFSNVDISAYPVISPDNWAPGIIDAGDFPEHWQLLMDNSEPSCRSLDQPYIAGASPEEFQYYVIDGFIVSDNLEVESLATVNLGFQNSDHNPLTMSVTLK